MSDNPPDLPLPTIEDVRRAAERIAGKAVRTPLLSSPILNETAGRRVLLKCENLQRTGSFKFRGAYNAIARLSPEARPAGVVAVSTGNHAQGVAEAARLFGVAATIVMPADAPETKRARTIRAGAGVIPYDRGRDDREAIAARLIAERGGTLIHPYENIDVIAGQGTIGLEIAADCAAQNIVPDGVVAPCGGGGLSSGIALAMQDGLSQQSMTIVEPVGFDDLGQSLGAGRIVTGDHRTPSVCDALTAPFPGRRAFAIHQANGTAAVTVTDEEALAAVAFAFRELKLAVEPGGAAGLAALLSRSGEIDGDTIVVVLSGGNIDEAMLARALSG
jgi:threonine dehydratase